MTDILSMGSFFGGIAKVSVKIIILPFLYLTYLYGIYLSNLINIALIIYILIIFKLSGAFISIENEDDEEVGNFSAH